MPLTIKDAQELIKRAYYDRDKSRGLFKTYLWFLEEIGELSTAIRCGNMSNIGEEIADVFAWLLSVANLLGVDVEEAFLSKYGKPPQKHFDAPNEC